MNQKKFFLHALLIFPLFCAATISAQIIGPPVLPPIFPPLPVFTSEQASTLEVSDGPQANDPLLFGSDVSLYGRKALVGAREAGENTDGRAYLFNRIDRASGLTFEDSELSASDGGKEDYFGNVVSLSSSGALVGAQGEAGAGHLGKGKVYFYNDAALVDGMVSETAQLTSTARSSKEVFGRAVSLSGSVGLVGATGAFDNRGIAYLFRNLDTASGNRTEDAILQASDGSADDRFGISVSLFENRALVGATDANLSGGTMQGAVYLFRGLGSATGTITESAKLTASDRETYDRFGLQVALSDELALVSSNRKKVYLYRIGSASGTIVENAKLDYHAATGAFGSDVALSGTDALVGAPSSWGVDSGAVFLYRGLDNAFGEVRETVRIWPTFGEEDNAFGRRVALDGDRFLISDPNAPNRGVADRGVVYSGTISALTELDRGRAKHYIDEISFQSRDDWVIGASTSSNHVILNAFNSAKVLTAGKAVYIGRNAGANNNRLVLHGKLSAAKVYVGSTEGNKDNALELTNSSDISGLSTVRLAAGNFISIPGDFTDAATLLAYLDRTDIEVFSLGSWVGIHSYNIDELLAATFEAGETLITPLSSIDYASWIAQYFPEGDPRTDPEEDADGDGFATVLEYLFNTNPDDATESPEFNISTRPNGLILEIRVMDRADLVWEVQVSDDLENWTTIPVGSATEMESYGDGSSLLRFSTDTGTDRGFVRVQIDPPMP